MSLVFMEECRACGAWEERLFEDSWSGVELCLMCLGEIINDLTNSPASERDNLVKLLIERTDYEPEDDEDRYVSYEEAFGE